MAKNERLIAQAVGRMLVRAIDRTFTADGACRKKQELEELFQELAMSTAIELDETDAPLRLGERRKMARDADYLDAMAFAMGGENTIHLEFPPAKTS